MQYLYTSQMNAYLAARVSTQTTVPTCFMFSFHAFKLTSDPAIYAATSSDRPLDQLDYVSLVQKNMVEKLD